MGTTLSNRIEMWFAELAKRHDWSYREVNRSYGMQYSLRLLTCFVYPLMILSNNTMTYWFPRWIRNLTYKPNKIAVCKPDRRYQTSPSSFGISLPSLIKLYLETIGKFDAKQYDTYYTIHDWCHQQTLWSYPRQQHHPKPPSLARTKTSCGACLCSEGFRLSSLRVISASLYWVGYGTLTRG